VDVDGPASPGYGILEQSAAEHVLLIEHVFPDNTPCLSNADLGTSKRDIAVAAGFDVVPQEVKEPAGVTSALDFGSGKFRRVRGIGPNMAGVNANIVLI
jgi:hypothetical protein